MSDLKEMTPGEVLADASVADFIRELGLGIAAAQVALDDNSVRQMEVFTRRREDLGGRSLLDLGLMPAFYHYQHADITCSMQIRMEVGQSDEFGFGARVGFGDTEGSSSSEDTSETTSETVNRRQTRSATLTMRADSTGVFALEGGTEVTPAGDNPYARLADLRRQLVGGDSGIDTILADPPTTKPEIALNTATEKVLVNSPTVAFLRPDSDAALFRISANTATDYVINDTLTISTTPQADLETYAIHVVDQFTAAGFTAGGASPSSAATDGIFPTFPFDTGNPDLTTEMEAFYARVAGSIAAIGRPVEIVGFTDLQRFRSGDSDERNLALGLARAKAVQRFLRANGVPDALIPDSGVKSEGTTAARAAGDAEGQDNPDFRVVRVRIQGLEDYYVSAMDGPDFDPAEIAPSNIGDGSVSNAFVFVFDAAPLSLSGKGVTIDGTSFAFSGAANGAGPGTAASHANNLAEAINATDTHAAWAQGNVVTVSRAADEFTVRMFTVSDRDVRIAGRSAFAVTQNFTRRTSSVQQSDSQENRAIAVGVSVDGRFSRQFNAEVTGNSTISARLVSIPAPPEFLEQIRAFQTERSS